MPKFRFLHHYSIFTVCNWNTVAERVAGLGGEHVKFKLNDFFGPLYVVTSRLYHKSHMKLPHVKSLNADCDPVAPPITKRLICLAGFSHAFSKFKEEAGLGKNIPPKILVNIFFPFFFAQSGAFRVHGTCTLDGFGLAAEHHRAFDDMLYLRV